MRLLPDLSAPAAPSAAPVAVAFTVSADGMDAQGAAGRVRPRRRRRRRRLILLLTLNETGSCAPRRRASSAARTGDASRRALREYRRESRTRTLLVRLLRRVYAPRLRVARDARLGAMARCAFVGADAFPRTALGDGGGVFATTVALGFEPRRYAGAARHESRHAPTVVSVTPRVVPAAGGVEITLVGTAFAGAASRRDARRESIKPSRASFRGAVSIRRAGGGARRLFVLRDVRLARVRAERTSNRVRDRARARGASCPGGLRARPGDAPRRDDVGRRRRRRRDEKMSRRRFSSTARPRAAFTRSRSARSGPSPAARPSTCST